MSSRGIESLSVIHNPVSSRAGQAKELINQLRDSRWGRDLEVVETIPPSEGSNIEHIRQQLRPGILLNLTGDGGLHYTVNAMITATAAGEIGPDEFSLVPGPFGSANDLSLSLYGGNIMRNGDLWKILDHGEAAHLDVMEMAASDGRPNRFMHSYFDAGFIARGAVVLNKEDFRARRKDQNIVTGRYMDTRQVCTIVPRDRRPPFVHMRNEGEVKRSQEFLLSLVPRVAAGLVRPDTLVLDGKVVCIEMGEEKFLPKAMFKIAEGYFRGKTRSEEIDGDQHLTFYTQTVIQCDGEPDLLPAGTEVTLSHRRKVVPTLILA